MKKSILLLVSFLALAACSPTDSTPDNEQTPEEQPASTQKVSGLLEAAEIADFEPAFATPWKPSPDASKEVTIEGRGETASEEGEGILVVKDSTTNVSTLYSLSQFDEHESTFKYVTWIDEHRLFVIIGFAYGTVSQGGDLYILDIDTNTLSLAMEAGENEEFVSIALQWDGITFYFKKFIHDENFEDGRYEEGKFTLSSIGQNE